ncbi:MAG: acyl-CoA thioesterase [Rhodocyclaceae bacterium]|nr:acyl-CoA thioesterase [Rhodocyclaceae bacterium]MBX3668444.1 acyl-CoA thioesterase [Rhodocyclaceae bacterium]
METRNRQVVLRFLAQPGDVNFGGKVHGGTAMKWIDQAGYACAVGWSGRYCVTVYVGGIRFYKPILVGSLVEVEARVIHTGRTSMHVAVDVRAGDLKDGDLQRTTHCVIVFVAVNDHGNPTNVTAWTPQSEAECAEQRYAVRLMELRQGMEDEMRRHAGADAGT